MYEAGSKTKAEINGINYQKVQSGRTMKNSKISSEEPKIKGDARLPTILLLPTFVVLNKSEERRYLERTELPVPILTLPSPPLLHTKMGKATH